MFSSWSINKPHFYSAVPQGYFLLLWFHNAFLSCALMLIWKFDALHAWFSPIAAQGQNKPLPLTFPFDLASQLFSALCPLHPPPASSPSFSFFIPLISSNVQNSKITGLRVHMQSFQIQKKEPVRSLCVLFMKNSPFADLVGVRNRRSTGTWFLGAFRKLPGEKCPKTHLVWSLTIFSINHWSQ